MNSRIRLVQRVPKQEMLSETEIYKSRRVGSAVIPAAGSSARGSAEMPSELGEWPFSGSAFARSCPITVGLIGGHCLLRNAIARHLAARDGMDVLCAFESVADFLASEVE